jgi:hypothetical protein
MARIIPDREISHTAIEGYLRQQLGDYSNYMQGAPVFVTYYSKDSLDSTHNRSLNSVANAFGEDSPVKFNRIENAPVWQVSGINLGTDMGTFGPEADVTGELVTIPGTFEPRIDDVFTIFHDGVDFIFRVNNVEYSSPKGNRFCKLSWHLTSDVQAGDLPGQTSEEYVVVGDGSSPDRYRVVRKDRVALLADLSELRDRLQDDWVRRFCRNRYDVPAFANQDGSHLYDYALAAFVQSKKLLSRARGYRDEFFFMPIPPPVPYEVIQQPKTLVAFVEGKSDSFEQSYVETIALTEDRVMMWPDPFLVPWVYTDVAAAGLVECYPGLAAYIAAAAGTEGTAPHPAAAALRAHRAVADVDAIFELLNAIVPSSTVSWYYYGPIALYIAEHSIERLRTEST